MECYSSGALRNLAGQIQQQRSGELYEHLVLTLLTPRRNVRPKKAA
jgi:hypothetical protein